MKQTTLQQFKAARRVGVPLIAWQTPDAAATIQQIKATLGDEWAQTPAVAWDIVRGCQPLTNKAPSCDGIGGGNAEEALREVAPKLPKDSLFLMLQAHRYLDDKSVAQAVWNLRDAYKSNGSMLVMLAPSFTLPPELSGDVVLIDEALPDAAQLQAIVSSCYTDADATTPKGEALTRIVDSITGLPAFAAEQVVAMSFDNTPKGYVMNMDALWQRKKQAIESTRGLSVWSGGEKFADVAGVENAKRYLSLVINGRRRPRVVVHIDEIEKSIAGQGDSSGVNQDQLGVLLQEMEDKRMLGMLLVGHPGSAKSLIAKATSGEAGIPGIRLDLGGMKAKHVGDSEQNIRGAMKMIDSISQGCALVIATANKLDAIPPELQRRFTLNTFFFDLPSAEERAALWSMYRQRYEIDESERITFDDEGWTGADVKNCCERAWMFDTTLDAAAEFATPIAKTRPAQIEALRAIAHGSFISASNPGLYSKDLKAEVVNGARRTMRKDSQHN